MTKKDMIQNIRDYANSISTIDEFVDAVRKVPGMYIGATDRRGIINSFREVLQNSFDQIIKKESPADMVKVHYNEKTREFIVEDNGLGIPFDKIIDVYTTQHTSGNYNKKDGEFSAGMHGIGAKATNALSDYFIVESYILGEGMKMEFELGRPKTKTPVKIKNNKNKQGTVVRFKPSFDIFSDVYLKCEDFLDLIVKLMPLMPTNTKAVFIGTRMDGETFKETITNKYGIAQHILWMADKPLIEPITCTRKSGDKEVEVVFTYDYSNIDSDPKILSFANFCPTIQGTHIDGALEGLYKYFKAYMNNIYLKNNKIKVTNNDIKSGLCMVVSVKHIHPEFTGQAKEIFSTKDIVQYTKDCVYDCLCEWEKTNPKSLNKAGQYLKEVAQLRIKEDSNKVNISKQFSSSTISSMPKKYKAPTGKSDLELLIPEGDSAGGQVKTARCHKRQGVIPIKGKIPNSFSTVPNKLLQNPDVAALTKVIGGGWGKNFDIDKVKWDKIIIMTDADSDGAHIRVLLMMLFLLYMKPLVLDGRIYSAIPPLYGVKQGKKTNYYSNRKEFTEFLQKEFSKKYNIVVNKKPLRPKDVGEILYNNLDYAYELEKISDRYAIDPYLLETIVSNVDKPFNQFKKSLSKYSFLSTKKKGSSIIVEGLENMMYHNVVVNDSFIEECSIISEYLDNNKHIKSLKIDSSPTSLYELMKLYELLSPSNITRYKGLGEMNPSQLAESSLHPDANRSLIQYNVEDINKEIDSIRKLQTDKTKILKFVKNISRHELIQ